MSLPTAVDRRRWIPGPRIAAPVAVLIVVAGLLSQVSQPTGIPSGTGPQQTRGAASGVPGSPAPESPAPIPWEPVSLAPYQPLAELTAARSDSSGVDSRTTFTLHSTTTVPAVALAAGLTASPSLKFTVTAGATSAVATLKPATPLVPGTRYRLRLTAPDGSLAGTWSFRTAGPLHVAGLLPRDRTTGVPVRTGIEVTFDQDDPTDFPAHFSITPDVPGRFEVHDRTWVFVPAQPLEPGTLYTYTIRKGVTMQGSSETLESNVSARFETEAASSHDPTVEFDRVVFDVRTGSRALLGLWIDGWDTKGETELPTPTSLAVNLFRFPTINAAAAAVARLSGRDDWLTTSSASLVSTDGLTKVASFDGQLTDAVDSTYVLHVPVILDPGVYLAVVPRDGRDAQAVIQVTDLAAYGLSSTTRTVVWLSDLTTGSPAIGATITLPGTGSLGVTDQDGLLVVDTPEALQTSGLDYEAVTARVLTVRTAAGRTSVVPLGASSGGHYAYNDVYSWSPGSAWWSVFSTDRAAYRTTDTIHVWGFVRSRDTRAVPQNLSVRLVTAEGTSSAAIVSKALHPTARGAFVVDVPVRNLPLGSYLLELLAGSDVVATTWLDVRDIRKPAFELDVRTDHRAYITGSPIKVTATASFFDGTTAAGLDLTFGTWDYSTDTVAVASEGTTDVLGQASASLTAKADGTEGASSYPITIVPRRPEEGEIRTDVPVYVFPASVWLTGDASLSDGRLRIAGTLSRVDIATVDKALERAGEVPAGPLGPTIAGKVVSIQVIRVTQVRSLVRTEYDYVEKQSVPIYDYSEKRVTVGTWSRTTGSDGAFSLAVAVPNSDDSYSIEVRAKDDKGRTNKLTLWSRGSFVYWWRPDDLSLDGPDTAKLGETVDLVAHDKAGATPAGSYLFIVGSNGIRDVQLRSEGSIGRTFTDRDLPGFAVRAVHLTASGLELSGDHDVRIDHAEKSIRVSLTPDQSRYEPGDTVTLAIRTTDLDGRPVAADVVIRAIDQKLYSMGTAWDASSVDALLRWVGPGFLQSYASAFAPRPRGDGGGMGGGGQGGREDFQDALTFQLVSTDTDGNGRVSFKASDDLTSWHVSASAFSAGLDAGDGVAIVPVGLPFFVDATLAPSYLAGEQPIVRLRAYGASLKAGDSVRFTVSAPALGIEGRVIDGKAFDSVRLPLPSLPAGDVRITIDARRVGSPTLTDKLVRTIHVVPRRLTVLRTTYQDLGPAFTPTTGVGLTTYLVTDAGRGSLIPPLQDLARAQSSRFDRSAAAEAARALLTSTFTLPADGMPPTGFDPTQYQNADGIALLPYGTADLALAAEAALVVPGQIDRSALRTTLRWFLDPNREPEVDPTRTETILAYVGLAGLDDEVLDELRVLEATAAHAVPLTVTERLWLALGYLASGDEAAARAIERDILATAGRAYGPWVRLDVATEQDLSNGLMLLLAGSLGDPISTKLARFLADHPSSERSFALEELGYANGMLERLARSAGSFAWSVAGERHLETLEPGGSFSVALTPEQQQTLSFERLTGELMVTTNAIADASAEDLPSTEGVAISRTIDPPSSASETTLVRVTIKVTLSIRGSGCFTVSDIVPSGLAPIANAQDWPDGSETADVRARLPDRVDGQRVEWCYDPSHPTALIYVARVVSPGTYTWEPAIVQDGLDTSIGASTPTTTYTIE